MHTRSFIGLGASLKPLANHGEKLTIVRNDAGYRVGDIVVYTGQKVQVCHRILARKKMDFFTWYFLKGDNNFDADGWIPDYRIEGRVTAISDRSLSKFPIAVIDKLSWARSAIEWWFIETFCVNIVISAFKKNFFLRKSSSRLTPRPVHSETC